MITMEAYFARRWTSPEITPQLLWNARELLRRVNRLLEHAARAGAYKWVMDPDTASCISGSPPPPGGLPSGDGGFRGSDSTTGTTKSLHRSAQAVDIYDPDGTLDKWLSLHETPTGGNTVLEMYELYREHPHYTPTWCHLQGVGPRSGKRTFIP